MELQLVTKEIIKPSFPTIKTYNLSFLDQQMYGALYSKLFFFYPNTSVGVIENIISERTRCLKTSLSEVLNCYYPLAGKITDKYSVYTSLDDGAEFIEARVNGTLSDYLEEPDINMFLAKLVSDDFFESFQRPLLIIQASFFACGGLAIGINISHRIADAASLTCFMNAWAGTAMGNINNVVKPDFSGSLTFPPSDQFAGVEILQGLAFEPSLVTRRFVFSESHIIDLQEKATKLGTKTPSRVQTISAFLWRIVMKMSTSKAGGHEIQSTLFMIVNIRPHLSPPICDQTFGNLFGTCRVHKHTGNMDLPNLTCLIEDNIVKFRQTYENITHQREKNMIRCLQGDIAKTVELATQQDARNNLFISSLCGFRLNDVDFGWGKPTWVANYCRANRCVMLTDTVDGTGIEAWVTFSENDMVVVESDEELLANATSEHPLHGSYRPRLAKL